MATFCFVKIDLHALALRSELLIAVLLGIIEIIERLGSSGIGGHSKSDRTQTKLNGRGGMPMSLGPLNATPPTRQTSRPGVRRISSQDVFRSTMDCHQPPVQKVLVIHVVSIHRRPSRTKRAASEKNP